MINNKTLLGGLAAGVLFFVLGFLVYGMLLKDFMAAHTNAEFMRPEEEMVWWAMIVSNFTFGILLALIISWSKTTGVIEAAKISAMVAVLFGLTIDLSFYSMSKMFSDLTVVFVDIASWTVMSAIGGAVIGWIMDMGKKES